MLDRGRMPSQTSPCWWKRAARRVALAVATALGLLLSLDRPASAAAPASTRPSSFEASTSDAARQDAIRSIPLERLAPEDRAKVTSVLTNVSIFRRMPVKVVDCDPDMYLFLVRHPDVVVNIWEVLKLSKLQLREVEGGQFQVTEPSGSATARFVYQSHDTHVIFGEGTYQGPLLARPVKGRGVLVLKTGYVRETNGRYYITSRLDCFLAIEPIGAELLTKTVSPLFGKTVDNNFSQTVGFVSSLSHTAETNQRGVRRLAAQLTRRPARSSRPIRGIGRGPGGEIGRFGHSGGSRTDRSRKPAGRAKRTLTPRRRWLGGMGSLSARARASETSTLGGMGSLSAPVSSTEEESRGTRHGQTSCPWHPAAPNNLTVSNRYGCGRVIRQGSRAVSSFSSERISFSRHNSRMVLPVANASFASAAACS